jgi:hypothetical protein
VILPTEWSIKAHFRTPAREVRDNQNSKASHLGHDIQEFAALQASYIM